MLNSSIAIQRKEKVDCWTPFDSDIDSKPNLDGYYKVYNDGGHYIGTPITFERRKRTKSGKAKGVIDYLFDSLYSSAMVDNLRGEKLKEFIKNGILKIYSVFDKIDSFIEKRLENKKKNLYQRKKRFKRKAYLNKWTHFVTFTYDDKKHDSNSFEKKLRRCLSNLATRRKWRYMGVFERAPVTGRLHFHALIYVPDGEMIGTLKEVTDYDKKQGKLQVTYCNDFFAKNFGRNDFKELNAMELKNGTAINYLLKYIAKTNEKIVYSRGILTEICLEVKEKDIVCSYNDYVEKFIFFDDFITWEKEIMNYKPKQLSFIDLICNGRKALSI